MAASSPRYRVCCLLRLISFQGMSSPFRILAGIVYNTSMILDILVIVIFIFFAVRGKARGIGESLIHLAATIAGISLGVMFTQPLTQLLQQTSLDESIQAGLVRVFDGSSLNLVDFVPQVIRDTLESVGVETLSIDAQHFTNTAITVFSFLLITFGVSLISIFLRRRLKKARKEGTVIGNTDSFAGLLIGMVKGAIAVCLFLAFMFPLAGIFLPDRIQAINDQLNTSYIAGPLYDVNPLLLLLKEFTL